MKHRFSFGIGLGLALLAIAATKMIFQYPHNATPAGSRIVLLDDGTGTYDESTIAEIVAANAVSGPQLQAATNTTTLGSQGVATVGGNNAFTGANGFAGATTMNGPTTVSNAQFQAPIKMTNLLSGNFTWIGIDSTNAIVVTNLVGQIILKIQTNGAVQIGTNNQSTIDASGNILTSGTYTGSGSGITNTVTCIPGINLSTLGFTATAKYTPLLGMGNSGPGSTENAIAGISLGGTYSSLIVKFFNLGLSTNAVVTLMTNGVASNIAASAIGGGVGVVVNGSDVTHSVTVPDNCTVTYKLTGDNPTAPAASVTLGTMIQFKR